jgi:hypothetical protein
MFENQNEIGIIIPEDIRLGVVNGEEWAIEALKRIIKKHNERMMCYEDNKG